MPSDGNGLYNKLTISFKDLNKIADLAGIQPQETGKLKWTVMSSKGINVQKSTCRAPLRCSVRQDSAKFLPICILPELLPKAVTT
jgi:hypothetical protein